MRLYTVIRSMCNPWFIGPHKEYFVASPPVPPPTHRVATTEHTSSRKIDATPAHASKSRVVSIAPFSPRLPSHHCRPSHALARRIAADRPELRAPPPHPRPPLMRPVSCCRRARLPPRRRRAYSSANLDP